MKPSVKRKLRTWANLRHLRRYRKQIRRELATGLSGLAEDKKDHPRSRKNITHTQAFEQSHKSSTQTNLLSINKSTMPPATTTTDSTSNSGNTTPPPMRMYGPTMPRPGQPGAMQFIGHNITEFLEEWNIECEDFGLTETQRCARFPNYCTPEIKETVKLLPGYIASNWATLQSDVKKLYWPKDKPKNTMAALDKLIKEAPGMDLNVYVLKYTSISEALVAAHALSSLNRVAQLLDGLSEDLHRKVVRHCTKQGWKLSTQDSGTTDPEYDAINSFILTEAQTNQTMAVYDSERSLRERTSTSIGDALHQDTSGRASAPAPTPSPARTTPTPASAPSAGIAELTKQFAQLTLLLQANLSQPRGSSSSPGGNSIPRAIGVSNPW